MRFLSKVKDGGPESTVTAYILIEIKCLFSIMILRFDDPSRPVFHTHAFNSISWLLKGCLDETFLLTVYWIIYQRHIYLRLNPFIHLDCHFIRLIVKVLAGVLTFRSPWTLYWFEYDPINGHTKTLTHGRTEV